MKKAILSQFNFSINYLLLLPVLLLCICVRAQQPGELDISFNPEDIGLQVGGFSRDFSFYPVVRATAIQKDNKIIIGGNFNDYDGQDRNFIARLNADGSLDSSFDPGTGFNGGVESIAIQPDGKIIVGGSFSTFDGVSRASIARLNANGSLDTSFDPGIGFNHHVLTVVVQPDGKIIAGGKFTSFNDTDCNYIARLNTDGTFDTGFDSGTGFNGGTVEEIVVQPDEKIIVGGSFYSYDGINRSGIARLNADGSLDGGFNPGHGVSGQVLTLALQPDGKIIAGGIIFSFHSTPCKSIVRINPDGSLDPSFAVGLNTTDFDFLRLYAVAVQPDGKIIVGGDFNSYNNGEAKSTISHFARLNTDGSIDTSFDLYIHFNNAVQTILLQADGKIVVGGEFANLGTNRRYICRLNGQGSIDTGFNYVSGFDNFVNTIAVQADGKIIVGGNFLSFNDKNYTRIARLNADGTLDTSFNPGSGFNSDLTGLSIQEDGKILVGGAFTQFNGSTCKGIVRLNADGSLDTSFESGTDFDGYPSSFILCSDGKIIVYNSYFGNASDKESIVRLNSDGSLDHSFTPATDFSHGIATAAVQTDGKILAGGNFQDYKGLEVNHILRFNTDGSLDTDFNPGTGLSGPVGSLLLQEDGKIVVIGDFENFNGTDRKGIVRLNTDGSLDTDFNPQQGPEGSFSAIGLQAGGKLIVTGEFSSYGGINRNRIARINSDGSLDISFDPGTGFNARIYSLSTHPDGSILAGGLFTSYNGYARNHIVRILGGEKEITGLPTGAFSKKLLVYPNPFTSEISVKLHQTPVGKVQVLVRDLSGRTVYSEAVITTVGHDLSVNLENNLPKGMYLLQLQDEHEREIGSYKVIKQ